MIDPQFNYWRAAVAGAVIDTEKGNPRSGYYRSQSGDEVIGIWTDTDGVLQCERSKFDGSKMDAAEIDELFGWVCRYPIPYKLFEAVIYRREPLPPEYRTRLTLKEIQDGVAWTPELGRQKLGMGSADLVEEAPAIGDNNPPQELPPHELFAARIEAAGKRMRDFLGSIGGKPKTQTEADKLADYGTRFTSLYKEADEKFKAEKKPFIDGGREVDARWRFREKATEFSQICKHLADQWRLGEEARLAEEANRRHAEQQRVADNEADALGEPPLPIPAPEPPKVSVGTARSLQGRNRPVWKVTDAKAFTAYLLGLEPPPADFLEALDKIAHRIGQSGVPAPGITKETARSVA